jgi:hypothetical protein
MDKVFPAGYDSPQRIGRLDPDVRGEPEGGPGGNGAKSYVAQAVSDKQPGGIVFIGVLLGGFAPDPAEFVHQPWVYSVRFFVTWARVFRHLIFASVHVSQLRSGLRLRLYFDRLLVDPSFKLPGVVSEPSVSVQVPIREIVSQMLEEIDNVVYRVSKLNRGSGREPCPLRPLPPDPDLSIAQRVG